jgi:hypothetical protein
MFSSVSASVQHQHQYTNQPAATATKCTRLQLAQVVAQRCTKPSFTQEILLEVNHDQRCLAHWQLVLARLRWHHYCHTSSSR